MRLTPALEYEKLRQDADSLNKIILNKDGKWYHVYEWSAWPILYDGWLRIAHWKPDKPTIK